MKKEKAPGLPRGFWFRFFLVFSILAIGLIYGIKSRNLIIRSQAASYGLIDNSGRVAKVTWIHPLEEKQPIFEIVLVSERDYPIYVKKAFSEGKGVLTYYHQPQFYPVRLGTGVGGFIAVLNKDGVVLQVKVCSPKENCIIAKPLPYQGLLEHPNSSFAPTPLSKLKLIDYGNFLNKK